MEPALRRGDRDDGVGGGVWRIVLRAQSYARSAQSLRAELSKMLCGLLWAPVCRRRHARIKALASCERGINYYQ